MNEILEIEFELAYNMGISPDFDKKEYYELIWLYERMAEQRIKENRENEKMQGQDMEGMLGGI